MVKKNQTLTHFKSFSPIIDAPGVISPSVKSLNGGV